MVGCRSRVEDTVVLASTVDQDIAAPMVGAFYRAEGGKVSPKARFGIRSDDHDALAAEVTGQTDGFTADLIWSDDVFAIASLGRRGLLMPRSWGLEPEFPGPMRAADRTWRAFACTARVILINTDLVADLAPQPESIDDLVHPRWAKRCGIALPTAGSSAAIHWGIIASERGIDETARWYARVSANAVMMRSDAQVASAVMRGELDWGITGSNHAILGVDEGKSVRIRFPDQAPQSMGTVRIPLVVAVLKDADHPVAGARFADYLVSSATEDRLAMSDAANIPISRQATVRPRILGSEIIRWADVDYDAGSMAIEKLRAILDRK